jgi:hypothetical protein
MNTRDRVAEYSTTEYPRQELWRAAHDGSEGKRIPFGFIRLFAVGVWPSHIVLGEIGDPEI